MDLPFPMSSCCHGRTFVLRIIRGVQLYSQFPIIEIYTLPFLRPLFAWGYRGNIKWISSLGYIFPKLMLCVLYLEIRLMKNLVSLMNYESTRKYIWNHWNRKREAFKIFYVWLEHSWGPWELREEHMQKSQEPDQGSPEGRLMAEARPSRSPEGSAVGLMVLALGVSLWV